MKIIGKTAYGYLVEATDDELAHASGYRHAHEIPGFTGEHGSHWRGNIPIGTELKPTDAHKYLAKLRDHEEGVKKSELVLRALADMLRQALPETIIPPDVPATGEAQ